MTTENVTENKSMISGANTENLKDASVNETQNTNPADVLYPSHDKKDAEKKDDAAQNTEQKKDETQKTEEKKDDNAKSEEQKTGDEKKDEKADDKKEGEEQDEKQEEKQPVDLTDMALPEGFKADPELIKELEGFVNEHGLTKEAAEKLAPLGAKVAERAVAQINEGYAEVRNGWREAVANDPVIGNKQAMAIANKGLEAYGSPELRKLADETGLGDHPEFIRAFHKIGLTVKEDVIERGGSGDLKSSDAAEVMYPSMKKK
ncbi:MAG: hypothetical protein IT558_00690 [Alphaproteobacteria bacterium]|nr:hypothetical protein [Alphaproteobacteria bacterium]